MSLDPWVAGFILPVTGGKQVFTIIRNGIIIGHYSRRQIAACLAEKSLRRTDKFKDSRDCRWKPLKQWGQPLELGAKGKKKRKSGKGARRGLAGNLALLGPDIFQRRRRSGSFDIDAPCNICLKCRVKYDTDEMVRWVNLSCPRCGNTTFQGHETFDSDRALDSLDRYVEKRRYLIRRTGQGVSCCECSRRYSHEEKAAFDFGLCPWCGCRDFRELA